ncbi:MAG: alpha-1,6-mannanase, partial [Alistipes sp.]|nr:alpha-1,6-mannanase [Alistipes sp.]
TAAGCYERWFKPMKDGEQEFRMMESGDVWFDAVMLRGLIALYEQDENDTYLQAVNRSLDYAWRMGRDEHGLFGKFLSHRREEDKRSWLLTQAAYAEMSARMAKVNLR